MQLQFHPGIGFAHRACWRCRIGDRNKAGFGRTVELVQTGIGAKGAYGLCRVLIQRAAATQDNLNLRQRVGCAVGQQPQLRWRGIKNANLMCRQNAALHGGCQSGKSMDIQPRV